MNEEQRDQAAARALGGLSPEEAARVDDEAAASPELAAAVDDYSATVSMLEGALARERPPADLFDGVLERIGEEAGAPRPVDERPSDRILGDRIGRLWPAFAGGLAAAVAVAVVLVLALSGGDDVGPTDARALVQGTPEFSDVQGEASLHGSTTEDGVLVLELDDVPAPADGEHYEVWVLRESADGEMEAVGVFMPTDPAVELEFRLPGPGDYVAVELVGRVG